jgi:hypothetical protein
VEVPGETGQGGGAGPGRDQCIELSINDEFIENVDAPPNVGLTGMVDIRLKNSAPRVGSADGGRGKSPIVLLNVSAVQVVLTVSPSLEARRDGRHFTLA